MDCPRALAAAQHAKVEDLADLSEDKQKIQHIIDLKEGNHTLRAELKKARQRIAQLEVACAGEVSSRVVGCRRLSGTAVTTPPRVQHTLPRHVTLSPDTWLCQNGRVMVSHGHACDMDRAGSADAAAVKSPLSQLFEQKPFGFHPSTPKSLATSQTVAGLRDDTRLQEMSMYVTARGGTPLPALGPRADDDLGPLSPLSRVRSVPTDSPSPPADSSMGAFYSRTREVNVAEDGYMEQTGGWSVRHTQSGLQRGGEGASMRRSRSTFNPYGSMTGTSRHEGDFYQEKMASLPSVGTQSPPRAEGLDAAETQVRKLASLPSANESVEELFRKRGHEDAVPALQRQIHSMPDLHSDPAKTEASQRYNDDVDRLLRRLLVDVNISHKSLPSLPAQRQICTHLDKVHNWFDRSRSAAKDLMESAGAKKPSTANSPMQAGIYLPAGSPPLPGSVKWQRPERKKILGQPVQKMYNRDSKLEPRAESPAALDDSLADCETGDEGELLDALSDS
eukprot:s254_g25.t2